MRCFGLNIPVILMGTVACALAACSPAPSDRTAETLAPPPTGAGSNLPDNGNSKDEAGGASLNKQTQPITPSPWQPPAEVDPPHQHPGDRVEPAAPAPKSPPAPSS
jgi:hypothetical protein